MINISYLLSTPIAAYVFLPVFYRLQSASVYKSVMTIVMLLTTHVMTLSRYLEQRFGRTARLLASLAFSLQMTLYMGIVVYAPSLALSAVTGLSFTGSVISIGDDHNDNDSDNDNDPGVVCTFYSALGGMKAVLMTDVFQSLLMFAAIFSVISRIKLLTN